MFKLTATLLALSLLGCSGAGAGAGAGESDGVGETELGQLEQGLTAHTLDYTTAFGTCDTRLREKCSLWPTACPGGAACIVPQTETYWVQFSGQSSDWVVGQQNLAAEFWRVFSSGDQFNATEVTWIENSQSVNLRIRTGYCPCVTASCPGSPQIPDIVCIDEPGMVTLTESLPGVYKRPAGTFSVREITIDTELLAQYDVGTWTHLHGVMEHVARWSLGTILGVGSLGFGEAENTTCITADMMSPEALVDPGCTNFANWFTPGEACQVNDLSYVGSNGYYLNGNCN